MFTRIIKTLLGVAALFMLTAASLHADTTVTTTENGEFVAKVNGSAILRKEFDWSLVSAEKQFASIGNQPGAGQVNLKKEVLDRLVDIELMVQEAAKRGIVVEEKEITTNLDSFKGQFDDKENTFSAFLETNNLTEEEMKAQLRRQLVIQGFQKELVKELEAGSKTSDEDAKVFYEANIDKFNRPEQVRASHILISVDPAADDAGSQKARADLEAIRNKIKEGGDFAELARTSSSCPSSAQGGDLGFFGKGQMVQPFEEAAFALKPGETSEIVETQFGYHLIKMAEKKEAGTVPFEEVKVRISEYLSQSKLDAAQQEYIKGLRDKAEITTLIALD